ncbi:MAG: 50S ribosomal protein L23 [Deltaproteobacteria bacterium]
MNHLEVIKAPLITEKLDALREEQRTYAFEIARQASKIDVRTAVEKLFSVHVEDVRTMVMRGKNKRVGARVGKQSNWKKALVRLREGDKIEIFEGGA